MDYRNYISYLNSLNFFKKMLFCKVIDEKEYEKAEDLLAKKYCINKGNLYSQNELINKSFRAIYGDEK